MKASWIRVALLGIVMVALPAGCTSRAQKIVANVGPRTVTLGEFETTASKLDPNYFASDPDSTVKRRLIEDMINKNLLALEALTRHYEADSTVAPQLAAARSNILLQKLFDDEVTSKLKVSDADIKAMYEQRKTELVVRHILVDTKASAESLRALLVRGASFDSLAAVRTKDIGSKQEGGLLPPWVAGDMVPTFEAASYAMKPGQLSQPIESPFGWHLIKMLDRRPRHIAPLDSLKPELTQILNQRGRDALLRGLIARTKQQYNLQYAPDAVGQINTILVRIRRAEGDTLPVDAYREKRKVGVAFNSAAIATPAESAAVLARTAGEPPYLMRDVLKAMKNMPAFMRPTPGDTAKVREVLDAELIKRLMEREAAARKLADQPEVQRQLANKTEEILVTTLYVREIQGKSNATDAQAETYYKAHPEFFQQPPRVNIYRVSSTSKAQVDSVLRVIKGGKSIEAVGTALGENPYGTVGETGPQPVSNDPNDILSIAYNLKVGEISPTVESSGFWSVFKVLSKTPGGVRDWNSSRKDAQRYATAELGEAALHDMLLRLRSKYPVQIHADVLLEASLHHAPVPTPPAGGATPAPAQTGTSGGSK